MEILHFLLLNGFMTFSIARITCANLLYLLCSIMQRFVFLLSSPLLPLMSMIRSGSAHISCRAFLEHPRSVSRRQAAVFFDGLIASVDRVETAPQIACSFRYIKRSPTEVLDCGIYEIFAKVTSALLIVQLALLTFAGCGILTRRSPCKPF